MAKRGNIFYTDKDFTDLEIQQEFGFPVIVILHDNNSVIKKISAFDENGAKSIYDFSLAASKDFVTQSITTAISTLKDNTLEFPTFADFPQPGEVGNVYIDLAEDKIYIWDSASSNYQSQSWNQTIITGIQTQITALQNSKLDKGTYVGTAQDLYDRFEGKIEAGYNSIPKVGNGASGKVLESSVIGEINGKIGIGIAGEASEKLEVGGRIKSDGIVINETASAILPREIKFKDGKFKAALANGVEKAVLLEGSSPSTLIVRYTHNANLSYQPTAIDYATGYITVENHGFTSTISKFVGIFTNNMQILRTYNGTVFPYEWLNVPIFMKKIDNSTLMICNSSGNVIPVNPSSTQNLGKLDITKWHIEEFSAINLSEIPIGIFNIRIIIKGLGNKGTAVQNSIRYITLELYNSSGVFVQAPSYFNFITNQQNQQDCNFVCVFDFYGKDVIPQIIGSEKYNNLATTGNYFWANSNITPNFHTPLGVLGISGVKNPANYNWLGNGSVIEIYAL